MAVNRRHFIAASAIGAATTVTTAPAQAATTNAAFGIDASDLGIKPNAPDEQTMLLQRAIDRAARDVIDAAGYGPCFLHRLGHGLGIEAHEEPYIVNGNALKLAPGMVFSNEPGIYIEGRWGVRTENIMLVTEEGGRSFNEATRALTVMR